MGPHASESAVHGPCRIAQRVLGVAEQVDIGMGQRSSVRNSSM